MKILALFLALASVAGCGKTIEYRTIELTRPARPVLPTLDITRAQKIDAQSWAIIVKRHRMQRQYAEQLETIIDATRAEK